MKAAPFAYRRAHSLADAFRLMAESGPDAKLIAGGQSLLATLAFRLSEPPTLIDISRVAELKGIRDTGAAIRVGALTRHAELGRDRLIAEHVPLAAEAVPLIAHPAIRSRGTIGGSLAFADPAAELPAVAVALDAAIVAAGAKGERRIPATEFFRGFYETALAPGELIATVELPKQKPGERSAILELTRRSGDYAMAGVALRLSLAGNVASAARIACFGVGVAPVLARRAMLALEGRPLTAQSIPEMAAVLEGDLDPPADLHGGPALKKRWARVLLERALRRVAGIEEAKAV
jgi:carbon-monoxide dehydrogenase medium subunit